MTLENNIGTNECKSQEQLQVTQVNFDYAQCLNEQPATSDVMQSQNTGADWLPSLFFSEDSSAKMISASATDSQKQAASTTTSAEQPSTATAPEAAAPQTMTGADAPVPVAQVPAPAEQPNTTTPDVAVPSTGDKRPPAPQDGSTGEARLYKQLYEGMTTGKMSFDEQLRTTREYLQKYGQSDMGDNRYQVRFLREWLTQQENRKFVQIDLRDCVRKNEVPSDNEIGLRIAKSLGFTDADIALYASLQGKRNPGEYGEAFYSCSKGNNNKYWLDRAKQDINGGLVCIPEMNDQAIQNLRTWLGDHHKNPSIMMERARLNTYEEIFKHIYNPAANLVGGAMSSLGDIMQGLGLAAHLVTDKTFMDGFAEFLRKKGESLPMMGLYTDKEMNDAVVCLANIYGMAGGSAITYMTPGFAGNLLKLTPKAAMLISELAGAAGNAGMVYDTSVTRQATAIAMREMESGKTQQKDLAQRIEEIKQGKDIDPNQRTIMERRALISAALAAPVGVVQGRVLGKLSQQISKGVPIDKLPNNLIGELALSMGKGSSLSVLGLTANEATMVLSGAQTGREAMQNIQSNIETAALGGALVFGSAEFCARLTTRLRGLDSSSLNQATEKTVNAVNENIKHVGGNGNQPLSPEALLRVKQQLTEKIQNSKEGVTPKLIEEALKNDISDPTLRTAMAKQIMEGLDVTTRGTAHDATEFSGRDTIRRAEVTNEICDPRFSHINSDGGGSNCTACVGALFRSLREGKVVSTQDVYNIGAKQNNPLGQPTVGRFHKESDAINYVRQAGGLGKDQIAQVSPTMLGEPPRLSRLPEGHFAVTLDLKPGQSGERHIIYAQKTADGSVYFFDPQSGKAYSPETVKKVLEQHKPSFYKAEIPNSADNSLNGIGNGRIAPETHQAWNPEPAKAATQTRESLPPVFTISKDQWNNFSPETRKFVEDTFARSRNDGFARKASADEMAKMANLYEKNRATHSDGQLRAAIWKQMQLTTPPVVVSNGGPIRPPVGGK